MRTSALFLVFLIGFWPFYKKAIGDAARENGPYWTTSSKNLAENRDSDRSLSVSEIIKNVSPAVVKLQVRFPADVVNGPADTDNSLKFKKGIGSGFIIRRDGYLITNHHVVDGADSIIVKTTHPEESYLARVVGTDPYSDLALLKIKSKRMLPVLPLGDSADLAVGAWVVVMGYPFGVKLMVTVGIISGKGRALRDLRENRFGYFDLIQTDALIQPGSSGGALLNLSGEVVGVITAINSRVRGIGFAVPVDLAKVVISQLYKHGKLQRAYLGVRVEPAPWKFAEEAGLGKEAGVLVTRVLPKTPAFKAGLKTGDILLKFAGHDITGPGDMNWRVSTAVVGKPVKVAILRDKKPLTIMVEPIARESRPTLKPEVKKQPVQVSNHTLGLRVADLDSSAVKNQEYLKNVQGVVVLGFDTESAAKRFQLGDIITEVQGEKTADTKNFELAVQRHQHRPSIRFTLVRQGRVLFVALPGRTNN